MIKNKPVKTELGKNIESLLEEAMDKREFPPYIVAQALRGLESQGYDIEYLEDKYMATVEACRR
tara:strand:- start:148 stop:339 length:192 start_codon:yes stop_codon:yes gene_type:complete